MKRMLAVLLALCMLLSLVSCSASLAVTETAETLTETAEKEKETAEKEKETGPIVYPEGFSAGFGRARVTPDVTDLPILTNGGAMMTYGASIKSDLYVTCVAVCDGKNVALMYNIDIKFISESFDAQGKKILAEEFGIPEENVLFNATHSHTSPQGDSPAVSKFTKRCLDAVRSCADDALRSLTPTKIYTARGDTTGLAFVRRYVMSDGTYKGIHSANPSLDYVSHETEADPELRTVRFDCGDKKDIIMVNWQCHVASDASLKVGGQGVISADLVDMLRKGVEEELDANFIYFNGASGNINIHSQIAGEAICHSTDEVGAAVAKVVVEAVKNETEVASGPVLGKKSSVVATVRKDSAERLAAHQAEAEANPGQKYYYKGVQSYYDEIHINERNGLPKTQEIPLYAITFGEIAFAAAPYEMCDGSGMEIRAGSEFQTTFSLGYTGGTNGYMATDDMFPHGEYEVYSCRFVCGTAELCVAELLKMLSEMK